MCGIIGYLGPRSAVPELLECLRRLEYRGYDSAGLATLAGGGLHLRRALGGVDRLAALLGEQPAPGTLGIGHTRWATHGQPSVRNAHPHIGGERLIAVVHNGVLENDAALKRRLQEQGYDFQSDTDSETIAHLIAAHFAGDLVEAVRRVLPLLHGSYALVVLSPQDPGRLVGVRRESPLLLGLQGENQFLASDALAVAGRVDRVLYLEDGQLAVLDRGGWEVLSPDCRPARRHFTTPPPAVPGGTDPELPHAMLREIHEQPATVARLLRERLDEGAATALFGSLSGTDPGRLHMQRLLLTGCGSSYHAALVGEYLFEELAGIPTEVEFAGELRYRHTPLPPQTLVIALSQSGETADTLAALRAVQDRGCPTLALCNVPDSSLARAADQALPLRAGPELAVAGTKSFTQQVLLLTLLALCWGRRRHWSHARGTQMIRELWELEHQLRQVLERAPQLQSLAEKYAAAEHFLYLGRHYLYPVALEGALKMTEVSYAHAQGYPAAELKHGPLALVDGHTPAVLLAPHGPLYGKSVCTLREIQARCGPVIALVTEGDDEIAGLADDTIVLPRVPDYLQPLVAVVPLQLLAYYTALARGRNVDRPRNLAKCVTVE